MREVKAPARYKKQPGEISVFLAGSIEMGTAVDWQRELTRQLADIKNLLILNPRRDDWDSSWIQSIDNPQFREQVEWELKSQENADIIVFYFAPGTKSPITLLELGLFIKKNVLVCCPEGYWRKGNVDIVCNRYGAELTNTLEGLIAELRKRIKDLEAEDEKG